MATPQEIRKIRLANDYKQMCNIKGDIINWVPVKGVEPYIEEYQLTINIKTVIAGGATPQYRQSSVVTVTLPSDYPTSAPVIRMSSLPIVYHPNWWEDGLWCYGTWFRSEALGDHVIRMVKTLQYDTDITNEDSPANWEASRWYVANGNKGYFPCDKTNLPDPTIDPTAASVPSSASPGRGFIAKMPAAQNLPASREVVRFQPIQAPPPPRGFMPITQSSASSPTTSGAFVVRKVT